MKIGYARVSTDEQSDNAQIDELEAAGCERIYREKYSGRSKSRPELDRMIDALRKGDVIVVQRLDRLGRSLKDLIELLDSFKSEQVQFISLNESIDTTTAVGELAFHMIGSIAQFERRLISERTKAGLNAARARGRKGGRKVKLSLSDVKKAKAMLLDPEVTKAEVAKHFSVSRPTLNKALNQELKD
jgi:DNA invertase Pin-like site-specific DNA recombinase